MYAVEVTFRGEDPRKQSASEYFLVQRSICVIGCQEPAQIEIKELEAAGIELEVVRGVGRSFTVSALTPEGEALTGLYDGLFEFETAELKCRVYALDYDLFPGEHEAPDEAGIRMVREALIHPTPTFPAVYVKSSPPYVVSAKYGDALTIGRSRGNTIRIDYGEVSSRHARIYIEDEESVSIEDLGSTNGTFLGERQIAGRTEVPRGKGIGIAGKVELFIIHNKDELFKVKNQARAAVIEEPQVQFPRLVALMEDVRPKRSVITSGNKLVVGRDVASCNVWVGSPHVSRKHLELELVAPGKVLVRDSSTNGTYIGSRKVHNQSVILESRGETLDLGDGVKLALEFSEHDVTEHSGMLVAQSAALQSPGGSRSNLSSSVIQSSNIPQEKPRSGSILSVIFVAPRTVLAFYRTLSSRGRLLMLISVFVFVILLVLVGVGVWNLIQRV
jgi:pSer/pThr/pTyr-binding forkhead associated (FHA) protein